MPIGSGGIDTMQSGDPLASISILREAAAEETLGWRVTSACERVAAGAFLTAASPVLAGIAAAVAILSRRSPLIAHRRVGYRGETLWMLKFRTMWSEPDAWCGGWVERIDDTHGPRFKTPADPRVTSGFARFCRRYSLDELPQLWHVVRGEMSLVGPRPLTLREIREHYDGAADELVSVRPGIAGLWQTSGRNALPYEERRRLDLLYVRQRSAGLYARILARVVPEVLSGRNAW
jgi:lipopolysaccharide/colanic/teichoic acid biosynthesis glycosyltransferase